MQRRQTLLAVFIACAYPFMTDVRADDVWQGSYAVGNQCFCSGDIPGALATRIVPSPIGGQTVKQVCAKVGKGPGLTADNGVFNYTVYKDPQCGNGPFTSANGPRDTDCLGTIDGTYGSCQPAGPRWALAQVYNAKASADSASSASEIVAAGSATDTPIVKPPSLAAARPVVKAAPANATSEVASADVKVLSPKAALDNFNGKSVMLGGDRYLQARDGLPEQGGAPGSRIILDGQLYLRQDDNLNVADLYRKGTSPGIAAAKPVAAPAVKPAKKNVASKSLTDSADEKSVTAQSAAEQTDTQLLGQERKKQERIRREAQARAEFIKEQRLRDARLAAQKARTLNDQQSKSLVESSPEVVSAEDDDGSRSIVITDSQAVEEASSQVASSGAEAETAEVSPTVLSAMRLPVGARASSRDFAYVEAMPASYDIGGGGLVLEGSAHSNGRIQYLGKLGVSDTYQEVMIGGGYYVTPAVATRMTVVLLAGIEFGSFELRDEARAPGLSVTSTDNGVFLGALSRFVINNKFELKGGLGYSSFFEGDVTLFGGGYYHVTRNLDVMSRFELGDNDLLGIGVRYYY